MKWIIIVLMLAVFSPNSYAFSVDYAPPVEKVKKRTYKKHNKRIKKQRRHRVKQVAKDMKTSTLLTILAFIFIIPGGILAIYGAIASISPFYILGLVFLIIGLILSIVGLVLSSSEKKKNSGGMGTDPKKPNSNGMK